VDVPDDIVIPDKAAFKAAEVCALLKLQPYVLKSWENEFKDLGVAKTPGGPRVYRRRDVERAVRIRELMLGEGLTLAGVRRRLEQEAETRSAEDELLAEVSAAAARSTAVVDGPAAAASADVRQRVARVRHALRELHDVLSRPPAGAPAPTVAASAGAASPDDAVTGPPAPPVEPAPGGSRPAAAAPRPRAASGRAPRGKVAVADAPAPPRRELVIEPEPGEPSLFADGDAEVVRRDDA
jgi:DNA-binding transcriptional MerR regulator